MKKLLSILFLLIACFTLSQSTAFALNISENESVLPYGHGLFISNQGSRDKTLNPNKGYILYYKNDTFKTVIPRGYLKKPTAMAIYNDKLYVCDTNEIFVFDMNDYYASPDRIKFTEDDTVVNDIALYKDNLYVTVTNTDRVYKINLKQNNPQPVLWLNIPSPNGIAINCGNAYIASIPKDYKNIKKENVVYIVNDLNNPKAEKLNTKPLIYDGIAIYKGNILVSDWLTSTVYKIDKKGNFSALYHRRGMTPADITVNDDNLIIPDMFNNRIIIHNLKTKSDTIIK